MSFDQKKWNLTLVAISQYNPSIYHIGEATIELPNRTRLYIAPSAQNIYACETGTRYEVPSVNYVDIPDLLGKIQQYAQGSLVPSARSSSKQTKKIKPQIINLDEPDPIDIDTTVSDSDVAIATTETIAPFSIFQRIINWIRSW